MNHTILIYPDDIGTFKAMMKIAVTLSNRHKLGMKEFEPKRRPSPDGALGICYCDERRVSVVFRFKANKCDGGIWWPKPLSKDDVRDTVAHELAHLRYNSHCILFKAFDEQLRVEAKELDHEYCP